MIDWDTSNIEVLLNPRIPREEREMYHKELMRLSFPSHIWLTTSGTSGRFKFVALSKRAILCSAESVNHHLQATQNDIWLHCLPDFHVGGIGIWARAALSGAQVVKQEQWNPEIFCQQIVESKATLSALVPTQLYDLVTGNHTAPDYFRAMIIGGGSLNETLYRKACFLGWKLLPSYGLTECASQVATALPGQFDCLNPLKHVAVKVDASGSIWIKSDALLSTYAIFHRNSIKLVDPKENGWMKTGDKGIIIQDKLKILGRRDDFIKINGESVNLCYLQRVADQLSQQMDMADSVAIYPYVDKRSSHHIHLVCEGKRDLSQFIQSFNEHVMPYERIRDIHYLPKLPRSSLGKIQPSQIQLT